MEISSPSPKELGYRFPAEFELHSATWLSWPHKEASWPGKIERIYTPYCLFIKALAENESVHINISNEEMKLFATEKLQTVSADLE
ncbi:MAG TPA: agmatine deiminase family protein, partial [Puia sp.]|nr:agmatine deiminase family protein [Puia sp.]